MLPTHRTVIIITRPRSARCLLLPLAVLALLASGCVYGLDYEGQPDEEGDAPFGKLTGHDSGLALLAIDGERVKYPALGPVSFQDGGFSVRVEPGLHVFHLQYSPINTLADDIGERRRLDFGPPQVLTLTIQAGMEVKLKPEERGGRRWEITIEETKPLDD